MTSASNKQEKATIYYNNIADIISETSSKNLSNYFGRVAPLAKQHYNYQLDKLKIDSLANYYSTFASSLTNAITRLHKMKEFDTTFNTRKLLIEGYNIIKKGYDSTMLIYLEVYKTGWDTSPDSHKQIIFDASEIFNRTFENSTEKVDSFGVQFIQFVKKYNIKE